MTKKTRSKYTFSKQKTINKARKEHQCCHCKQPIEKGSSYQRTTGVGETMTHHTNVFFSHAWHKSCLTEHHERHRWWRQ